MIRIFVTRQIPDEGIKLLKKIKGLSIDVYKEDRVIPKSELKKQIKGATIIISNVSDRIDKEIMKAAGPSLKMIANYAVGYDNIDLAAAKKRKVIITNTPGVLTEAVAEHAFTLLTAVARRIVESEALCDIRDLPETPIDRRPGETV